MPQPRKHPERASGGYGPPGRALSCRAPRLSRAQRRVNSVARNCRAAWRAQNCSWRRRAVL
eukprot:6553299-Lingulodinium_polyedra.AAC.1